jgi:hypothetical protein
MDSVIRKNMSNRKVVIVFIVIVLLLMTSINHQMLVIDQYDSSNTIDIVIPAGEVWS